LHGLRETFEVVLTALIVWYKKIKEIIAKGIFMPSFKNPLTVFITLLFLIPTIAIAADVTLQWDPVLNDDVVGYRVYAREISESFDYSSPEWQGNSTAAVLEGFDPVESYYFVVRAYDVYGNESGDSNEVYWSPSGASQFDADLGSVNGVGSGGGGGCFIENLLGN